MDKASPKILALDTSSLAGSVALCHGERPVAECFLNIRKTHSEILLTHLDLLLGEAGWALDDLDLLAAVVGPGSFTGLRIGLATVKGLGQRLQAPVVGISSLTMLAMNLPLCPVPVCVFMDARKKEVYTQLFEWTEGGPQPLSDPKVLPPDEVLRGLPEHVALVGDAVPLYQDLIEARLGKKALIPPETAHQPRAIQAAWLASQRFHAGGLKTASELVPSYVRPSDAELSFAKN